MFQFCDKLFWGATYKITNLGNVAVRLLDLPPRSAPLIAIETRSAFQPGHLSRSTIGRRNCTRNCARMTTFLLVIGKRDVDREKPRFPLVNRLFWETKRNVLKSTISES
jgi:hypothetical protein